MAFTVSVPDGWNLWPPDGNGHQWVLARRERLHWITLESDDVDTLERFGAILEAGEKHCCCHACGVKATEASDAGLSEQEVDGLTKGWVQIWAGGD